MIGQTAFTGMQFFRMIGFAAYSGGPVSNELPLLLGELFAEKIPLEVLRDGKLERFVTEHLLNQFLDPIANLLNFLGFHNYLPFVYKKGRASPFLVVFARHKCCAHDLERVLLATGIDMRIARRRQIRGMPEVALNLAQTASLVEEQGRAGVSKLVEATNGYSLVEAKNDIWYDIASGYGFCRSLFY